MPQMHIARGRNDSELATLLTQFRASLLDAVTKAALIRGLMDNMNDAVNYSIIEDEFKITPQYNSATPPARITDTNCNGYKVLAYVSDIDNIFKSNTGDASNPWDKIQERVNKIINYLA